ncbi:MAG: LysR family transcriptional regulator [Alphaproteobacteria bacterium]|nr:LysR family transcriptional regulator [Alphaproteobacteria bacterium]
MDWDKLRIFHAVAEAGSFTHAGETLKLSQSAVSRQIGALERSLNVPLFQRHARGLVLTEQGQLLYRTAHEIFAKLAATQARLTDATVRPKGTLKVTTTVGLGSTWLTPRIKTFIEHYPEVNVSLIVDDMELDLAVGEADVAIRMAAPRQPDLIQRHLMTVHFHVYASHDYLERNGVPQSLEELSEHRVISFSDDRLTPFGDTNWLLEARGDGLDRLVPVFQVNSVYGIFRAVETGLGIASLPDYLASGNPRLIRILPEHEGPSLEAFFVYPEAHRKSKRVAVFRDFLIRQISDTPF